MKKYSFGKIAAVLATMGLWVGISFSASATLEWEAIGTPLAGNSWGHQFAVHGQAQTDFDKITAVVTKGNYTFENNSDNKPMEDFTQGTTPKTLTTWTGTLDTSTATATAIATGDSQNWVGWTFWFNGNAPRNGNNPLQLLLTAYLGGEQEAEAVADYHINGQGEWVWQIKAVTSSGGPIPPTVVPEPSTIIAGALLLLPFGVSTLRILRNKRSA